MEHTNEKTVWSERDLWLRWVLANSLSETVGLGSAFGVGVILFPYLQTPGVLAALATAVGAFVAWTSGMLPGTLLGAGSGSQGSAAASEPGGVVVYALAALMGLVAGAVLGTPQWFVLRRFLPRAILWVPANALAWAPGMIMAFVAADFLFAGTLGATTIVLAILILSAIGAVVGAIHGLALVWLLRPRNAEGRSM